jgi:hypothetical protein
MVLSIQLFIILGGVQVGLMLLERMRLEHAVIQAVTAGAREELGARCATAVPLVGEILGYPPSGTKCTHQGDGTILALQASVELPLIFPLFGETWEITTEERAWTP